MPDNCNYRLEDKEILEGRAEVFPFFVLSYALLRFFIEFVRDPDSSFVLVKQYYGMKAIQWVLLAFY